MGEVEEEFVLLSNVEGGVMDLINFEEGVGEGGGDEEKDNDGCNMNGSNMVNLGRVHIDPPEVGMIFNTWEEADVYYNAFGKQEGFGVVLGQSAYKTLKDGSKVKRGVTWRCECAGKPDTRRKVDGGKRLAKELEGKPVGTKMSKKCGCEAMMYLGLKENGKREITKVKLNHETHKVTPSKSMLVTKYKMKELEEMPFVRRKLHFGDDVGLSTAKMHKWMASEKNRVENMPFTSKDLNNLLSRQKKLKMKDGDSNSMMNYFQMMQKNNNNFYHIHRLDVNGVLQDVFWVDARSRAAYEDFGDVVF